MLYSRPQLKLLLALAVTLLAGLGVREWRAGFPDLADRLERFDRDTAPAPHLSDAPPERRAGSTPIAPSDPPSPQTSTDTGAVASRVPAATPGAPTIAPVDSRPIDINRAGVAELARLPGVGPGMAARIVAERERRGRFDSPEALRSVLGMGPKKLAAIRELVTVAE
jgi:competence ComEA-like helix-hairpin-helix protein